jgi:acetyltransferase-like isoleucine patch superfamily enzyme
MLLKLCHGFYIFLEKFLRWAVHPGLRASLLKLLGAEIGRGVRIHEVQMFNLKHGFGNLHVGDGAYIGIGCKLDLEGPLTIGARTSVSAGVTILTHEDAGTRQNSRLARLFPLRVKPTAIGSDCWVGANATVLCGVVIEDCVVIGAGSVVTRNIQGKVVAAGVPASPRRTIDVQGMATL